MNAALQERKPRYAFPGEPELSTTERGTLAESPPLDSPTPAIPAPILEGEGQPSAQDGATATAGGAVPARAERSGPAVAPEAATAFAAFLLRDAAAQAARRRRRLTYALAIGLHGALLAAGAAYSFWQVEELAAPRVSVSLVRLAAVHLPPPPPPPPARRAALRPQAPRPTPPPRAIVQPPEEPQPPSQAEPEGEAGAEDEPSGESGGLAGGETEGVSGGVVGSLASPAPPPPAPPPPPRAPELSPAQRKALLDRYLQEIVRGRVAARHHYPPEAERLGIEGAVSVRLVLDASGKVIGVALVGPCPHEILCEAALATVREAGPFPPPPGELGATIQVSVPLNYRLEE